MRLILKAGCLCPHECGVKIPKVWNGVQITREEQGQQVSIFCLPVVTINSGLEFAKLRTRVTYFMQGRGRILFQKDWTWMCYLFSGGGVLNDGREDIPRQVNLLVSEAGQMTVGDVYRHGRSTHPWNRRVQFMFHGNSKKSFVTAVEDVFFCLCNTCRTVIDLAVFIKIGCFYDFHHIHFFN